MSNARISQTHTRTHKVFAIKTTTNSACIAKVEHVRIPVLCVCLCGSWIGVCVGCVWELAPLKVLAPPDHTVDGQGVYCSHTIPIKY